MYKMNNTYKQNGRVVGLAGPQAVRCADGGDSVLPHTQDRASCKRAFGRSSVLVPIQGEVMASKKVARLVWVARQRARSKRGWYMVLNELRLARCGPVRWIRSARTSARAIA